MCHSVHGTDIGIRKKVTVQSIFSNLCPLLTPYSDLKKRWSQS
jgi:hypothetical protein